MSHTKDKKESIQQVFPMFLFQEHEVLADFILYLFSLATFDLRIGSYNTQKTVYSEFSHLKAAMKDYFHYRLICRLISWLFVYHSGCKCHSFSESEATSSCVSNSPNEKYLFINWSINLQNPSGLIRRKNKYCKIKKHVFLVRENHPDMTWVLQCTWKRNPNLNLSYFKNSFKCHLKRMT